MKIYNFLIPLLIFAFGMANCGRDLFGPGFEHYPGDLADTRFNNIILEHDYQWLIGNQENLWDVPFFYPAKGMLAGSDNHLGTFWLYVPFRLAGLNEINSFQAWVICLFALNFFVFYKVGRKLGLNAAASSAGAFVFTFSMPVLGSVHHIQTLCKFSFPLVFFFFYRVLFVAQRQNLIYFALSLTHVFYCSLYYGMFTLLLLSVFFIAALFRRHHLKAVFGKQNLWWLCGSAGILVITLVPLALPYMELQHFARVYTIDGLMPTLPHPYSYLMPHNGTMFYSFLFDMAAKHTGIFWEHFFFIGFISLVLVISAAFLLYRERKHPVSSHRIFFALCGITLLTGVLLTSAAGKYTLYRYVMEIDVFSRLKVMNRIVLLELFMAGMLVAYSLNRITMRTHTWKLALGLLVVLVVGEHWLKPGSLKIEHTDVALHHHEYINRAIEAGYKEQKAFVVLNTRGHRNFDSVIQIDAMMAALQKKLPTVNGYTTVADPMFFHVYSGNRKGVAQWLHYCHVDTTRLDEKILFIH